jgi:hypothetical protein
MAIASNRQQQHELMKALVEQSTKSQELLSHCVVPPRNTNVDEDIPNKIPL